ncbi:hypothetical protein AHEVV2_010 [Adoxophyes honmai entomopoxvirus 'L' virophage 2]|nr:hypothetical protein AHEVV2_010 [Adoxophyes honmai entomopoxvirus 'L' virophage 2]
MLIKTDILETTINESNKAKIVIIIILLILLCLIIYLSYIDSLYWLILLITYPIIFLYKRNIFIKT